MPIVNFKDERAFLFYVQWPLLHTHFILYPQLLLYPGKQVLSRFSSLPDLHMLPLRLFRKLVMARRRFDSAPRECTVSPASVKCEDARQGG